MKIFHLVMTLGISLLLTTKAQAQQSPGKLSSIEPFRLEITLSKTVSLVFGFAIISVDRGSKEILAQKANGVDNILLVKAAGENFRETNLTVVTADGRINTFIVNYAENPRVLSLSLTGSTPKSDTITILPEELNLAKVKVYAGEAANLKSKSVRVKADKYGIHFLLTGLFIQDNVLFYRLNIQNHSNINYDIGQLRFFLRDQKKAKRTASQEIEIAPICIYDNTDKIKGWTSNVIVFAVPKLVIPDMKYIAIQLMEKNGGRNVEIHVKNKHIMKANVLPAM